MTRLGSGKEWEVIPDGYTIPFQGDENVLETDNDGCITTELFTLKR